MPAENGTPNQYDVVISAEVTMYKRVRVMANSHSDAASTVQSALKSQDVAWIDLTGATNEAVNQAISEFQQIETSNGWQVSYTDSVDFKVVQIEKFPTME